MSYDRQLAVLRSKDLLRKVDFDRFLHAIKVAAGLLGKEITDQSNRYRPEHFRGGSQQSFANLLMPVGITEDTLKPAYAWAHYREVHLKFSAVDASMTADDGVHTANGSEQTEQRDKEKVDTPMTAEGQQPTKP